MDSATDRTIGAVTGTVENRRIDQVTLHVNGYPRTLSVQDGAFSSEVPLIRGENRIEASTSRAASSIIGTSNLATITAETPRTDIWTEVNAFSTGECHAYPTGT